MKAFKNKVDNFFKWVKGSELVLLEAIDVNEDPVRPHLNLDFRTSYGRPVSYTHLTLPTTPYV